LNEVHG
jgi:hypothetical protein